MRMKSLVIKTKTSLTHSIQTLIRSVYDDT